MKKTRRRIKWIAVAVSSLLALCLVVLCPLAFLYTRQQEEAGAWVPVRRPQLNARTFSGASESVSRST